MCADFYNIIYLYLFDNNENKKIKNANRNESIYYVNKKNIEMKRLFKIL